MKHPSRPSPPPPVVAARRLLAALALAALAGCASSQTMESSIPPAGRPMWDRCSSSISAWCHRQGQGDPTLDRDCEENAAHDYGALADDVARRNYLTAHACAL
ncbi:MAG: hypothetical protein JWM10_1187 [Myxococcaceae bacterium]|nr:hypothetical protein [Myxococcaceae bacterium]